jgi:hypothetical protein
MDLAIQNILLFPLPYYEDTCAEDGYDSEFQVFEENDLERDAFE